MFQNIVSLIERVDDAANEYSGGSSHPQPPSQSLHPDVVAPRDEVQLADVGEVIAERHVDTPKLASLGSRSALCLQKHGDSPVGPELPDEINEQEHRLSAVRQRVAVAECYDVLASAELSAVRNELLQLRLQAELRQQLLLRLCSSVRSSLNAQASTVVSGEHSRDALEQLCCEVDVVVGGHLTHTSGSAITNANAATSVDAAERLESLLRIQQSKLDAIAESNVELRKRLADDEAAHQNERESWSAQWGELSAKAELCQHLTREVERRKEEALHAWTKMSSMQTALRQATEKSTASHQQLDALQNVLLIRDEELSIARAQIDKLRLGIDAGAVASVSLTAAGGSVEGGGGGGGAGTYSVSNSKLLRTIASKHKYGPVIHRSISVVDGVTFACVRLLARQAWLRLFIALYIFVLHVHMFHIVSLVVHAGLPHEVGDDVHDHIKNHLVK
jgi:hypothetical protein